MCGIAGHDLSAFRRSFPPKSKGLLTGAAKSAILPRIPSVPELIGGSSGQTNISTRLALQCLNILLDWRGECLLAHFPPAMRRFLVQLTPEQRAAQLQRAADEIDARVKEEHAAAAARPPPRGPGRPPSKRAALSSAADSDAGGSIHHHQWMAPCSAAVLRRH